MRTRSRGPRHSRGAPAPRVSLAGEASRYARVGRLADAAPRLVDELVRVDELDAHFVERPLRVGPVLRHTVSGGYGGGPEGGKRPRDGGGVTQCYGAARPWVVCRYGNAARRTGAVTLKQVRPAYNVTVSAYNVPALPLR